MEAMLENIQRDWEEFKGLAPDVRSLLDRELVPAIEEMRGILSSPSVEGTRRAWELLDRLKDSLNKVESGGKSPARRLILHYLGNGLSPISMTLENASDQGRAITANELRAIINRLDGIDEFLKKLWNVQ